MVCLEFMCHWRGWQVIGDQSIGHILGLTSLINYKHKLYIYIYTVFFNLVVSCLYMTYLPLDVYYQPTINQSKKKKNNNDNNNNKNERKKEEEIKKKENDSAKTRFYTM